MVVFVRGRRSWSHLWIPRLGYVPFQVVRTSIKGRVVWDVAPWVLVLICVQKSPIVVLQVLVLERVEAKVKVSRGLLDVRSGIVHVVATIIMLLGWFVIAINVVLFGITLPHVLV